MTTPPRKPTPFLEHAIESVIFASRWLMAPLYLGLIAALGLLVWVFFHELWEQLQTFSAMDETHAILMALSLVDLSLAANLVLIILFSGYENFVSKMEHAKNDPDRPDWMGTLDFSGLKIKLIASIVAISGVHLLKIFMNVDLYSETQLRWYVIIHITFVLSGVAFAAMDWIEEMAHKVSSGPH